MDRPAPAVSRQLRSAAPNFPSTGIDTGIDADSDFVQIEDVLDALESVAGSTTIWREREAAREQNVRQHRVVLANIRQVAARPRPIWWAKLRALGHLLECSEKARRGQEATLGEGPRPCQLRAPLAERRLLDGEFLEA